MAALFRLDGGLCGLGGWVVSALPALGGGWGGCSISSPSRLGWWALGGVGLVLACLPALGGSAGFIWCLLCLPWVVGVVVASSPALPALGGGVGCRVCGVGFACLPWVSGVWAWGVGCVGLGCRVCGVGLAWC